MKNQLNYSVSKDFIPEWIFMDGATNLLSTIDIKEFTNEVVMEILESNNLPITNKLFEEVESAFQTCFWENEEYISIHHYKNLIKKFSREEFLISNPELSNHVDWFCFRLRTKVALAMNPEKIDELVKLLKDNDIKVFSVSMFRKYNKEVLKNWFWKNCRWSDWKIDWKYVHWIVNEQYECEHSYQNHRKQLTKTYSLNKAREVLDELIDEKWYWYPADDLERLDKWVYLYLIRQDEYRIYSKRPDLELQWLKDSKSKPNWFFIAKDLWEKYLFSMRIWRWEWTRELELRSKESAIDELNDTINLLWIKYWNPTLLYNYNVNLYTWFKNHVRNDNWEIDWESIVELTSDDVKKSFKGNKA